MTVVPCSERNTGNETCNRLVEYDRQLVVGGRALALQLAAQKRAEHEAGAATPQTLNKRRVSVVGELFGRGHITEEQRAAAVEIAAVRYAISAVLHARVTNYGGVGGGGGGGAEWRPGLTRAYRERYVPWATRADTMVVSVGVTAFALVGFVVVDNLGLEQVRMRLGMGHRRTALKHLREALYLYAEMADWVDHRRPLLRRAEFLAASEIAA